MSDRTDGDGERPDQEMRQASAGAWRGVAVQTARDLWTSSVLEWAAALAFYAVLSLFPLLIVGLVVASYAVDAAWATEQAIAMLGRFLPEGEGQIEEIVTAAIAERRRVGVLSFGLLLLTGRRVLGGLIKGLNHVSDVAERDDTIGRKAAIELALTGGLVVLLGLAFASRRLLEALFGAMEAVPGPDGPAVQAVNGAVRVALLFTIFVLVYAFVPRGERLWRAVLTGAALATFLYVAAEFAFSVVVGTIWANLRLIYGPLALAALLLTWAWYVSLITLIGAGFASHVKVMIIERQGSQAAGDQHTSH